MSAEEKSPPPTNEPTEFITTPLGDYNSVQALEQKIDLLERNHKALDDERSRNAELNRDNASLTKEARHLRAEVKSCKSRATRELRRDKILSIVSSSLIGIGGSIIGADVIGSTFTWPGPLFVVAGLCVYACMFLSKAD